jgi:hypothetical protein
LGLDAPQSSDQYNLTLTKKLRDEWADFAAVREKGVVAVRRIDDYVIYLGPNIAKRDFEIANLCDGEEPISDERQQENAALNAGKDIGKRGAVSREVELLDCPRKINKRVGVKPLNEIVSLGPQVPLNLKLTAKQWIVDGFLAKFAAELRFEVFAGDISQVGRHPRHRQASHRK